ncbi:MAG TPA: hypothetical protein VKF59_09475 [Candidatus Dormibacteraeota bacterium]|nr:hypothetical protein [Candidatus Dormibacteraeota bacterium]
MVYRAADVVFQYLKPLIALLVVIPLAVGGFAFAFGRAQVVSARVWADRPVFTPDFTSDLYSNTDSPAQIESALMLELIGTDSFATGVEKAVQPGFETWSTSAQDQAFTALRAAFSVAPQGEHLFVISYTCTQPAYGVRVLQAIIRNYGAAVMAIESSQVGAAAGTLQASLDAAQQAMNRAVSAVQSYQAQQHLSDQDARRDPNYSTLLGQARSQTDNYLKLLAQVDAAQASQQAVISVQAAMFHVVDPPAVAPEALISSRTPGLKQAGVALGVVAAVEALLVYFVARRDPTIRSGEDIRRALGLKPLGSVPLLGSK